MNINWKLVLIIFVLFLLFTDGAILGENVRAFVEWKASGWDSFEEFMRALTGTEIPVEDVPS